MKKNKILLLTTTSICCIIFLALAAFGISLEEQVQINKFGVSALNGLEGVYLNFLIVDVSEFRDTKKTSNYMYPENWNDEFSTEVELALRRNGIKILGRAQKATVSGALKVVVIVNAVKLEPDIILYSFTVRMFLTDTVKVARKSFETNTIATTWSNGFLDGSAPSISGEIHLKEGMKKRILKEINVFCNDYLAANPKEPSKNKEN